jgi:hypothetical protein
MEDDLNTFYFLKMEVNLKHIMQPKTIKSKNNDYGTTPGNLVYIHYTMAYSLANAL